jgi:hypothetical protein
MLEYSTFWILFLTENFQTDRWAAVSHEICVTLSIEEEEKKNCVIPVVINSMLKVPISICRLKKFNIHSFLKKKSLDEFSCIDEVTLESLDRSCLEMLIKLFNGRRYEKESREKKVQRKQEVWLEEEKSKEIQRNVKLEEDLRTAREAAYLQNSIQQSPQVKKV